MNTNGRLQFLILSFIRINREFWAFVRKNKFYCKALQGNSFNSISVNSDLTVSCRCSDFWDNNKIGDLKVQTLAEIFQGPRVMELQKKLASGRFPILDCVLCSELRTTQEKIDLSASKLPEGIIIENTFNCQLKCLSCDRARLQKFRTKNSMSLDDVNLISKILKDASIKIILYYKQGEPFLSPRIKEELQIIKRDNPSTIILSSTNGAAIDTRDKFEAALLLDHIFISLPGIDQKSVSRYQRGANFDKSFRFMKDIVQLRGNKKRPVIEWKYVLFRWNDSERMLRQAIEMAQWAKVDILSFWKTLSPLLGISYRYFLKYKYFQNIGQSSWKGREIDFRKWRPASKFPESIKS